MHPTLQDTALWLYALARLGYKPSHVWLTAYITHSYNKVDQFSAQELNMVLWAVATMGWLPPWGFWLQLITCCRRKFKEFNAQDFATCIYSGVC